VFTAHRMLIALWAIMGVVPLVLQIVTFLKFIKPHHMSESLVVPRDSHKEVNNLTEICPMQAFVLAGVWWNVEPTHYFKTEQGIVCHAVVPQYNLHGNYFIGNTTVMPFHTSPTSYANDSYPIEMYTYHGSIGFYSFFEGGVGTYCSKDKTAYMEVETVGTYDMNGVFLAQDTGSTQPRMSYWYSITGCLWLAYHILTIRRSYMICRRYGRRCSYSGVSLTLREAMVFAQESLRLSAHGATNYHRVVLLYLVVEGIMAEHFLIIVNDGWAARVQHASFGYNLSGLVLLLFEMLEHMNWLREKWRMRIKRLFFSYEAAFVGELVTALAFQAFLSGLNRTGLKRSNPIARSVSYYVWSLVCHGIIVVNVVMIILSVRVLLALTVAWTKHRSLAVFSEPCCVDAVIGSRSRSVVLNGYHLQGGQLYYKPTTLKAYGLMELEDEGTRYLVMHKLHWFAAPRDNLIGIGTITSHHVMLCQEKPCWGIASFLDRALGGASTGSTRHPRANTRADNRVTSLPDPNNGNLPVYTEALLPAILGDNRV